nr:MAG TPA: hypothetical protein [Caudoviricetes sp.]
MPINWSPTPTPVAEFILINSIAQKKQLFKGFYENISH